MPGCTCFHAVLAQALDAVMAFENAEMEAVLALAESQRAGVRVALVRAFEAEAGRFAAFSRRAYAAADRLLSRAGAGRPAPRDWCEPGCN